MEKIKLKTLIGLWLSTKRGKVKESTLMKYENIALKFSDAFYEAEMSNLSTVIVSAYIEELCRKFHPSYVRTAVTVLKEIIRFAFENNITEDGFFYSIPKITYKTEEIKILTQSDCIKFNCELIESKQIQCIGILFALNMGLRLGEICALKWENVDLIRKSISVSGTVLRLRTHNMLSKKKTALYVTAPKTVMAIREVPVPIFLLNWLKEYKPDNNRIFILSNSVDRIPDPRNLQRWFKKKCKEILGYSVNFHALRHTFASLSISNGADPKTVSKLLGHSSVITTLKIYRNVSFEDKSNAIFSLEKVIGPKKT